MMLPGVELARRRRVHHGHEVRSLDPRDLMASSRPPFSLTAINESAVNARRRLEKKLRSFSTPSSPSSTVSVSSPFSNLHLNKANRVRPSHEITSMDDDNGSERSNKNEIKK